MRLARALAAAALAAALAAAGGCGGTDPTGRPAEPTKVTFVTGANIFGREAPIYVAIHKGWFRDAGLAVSVQPGKGTEYNAKILQAGRADFVELDITAAFIEYAKGRFTDFVIINAMQQRNLSCLIALEGKGIRTPRDLAGKKVAYIPGGVVQLMFPTYAKVAGFDGSQQTWVPLPITEQAKNLAAGTVDVSTQFVVGRAQVERVTGRKTVMFPYSDYLTDLYGVGVGVTRKTAEQNPDLVRRFNDALLKGLAYAVDHPQEAGQIYARYQKLQPAQAAAGELKALKPYTRIAGTPVGGLDPARVAHNIQVLYGAGVIPKSFDGAEVMAFDLAPASS